MPGLRHPEQTAPDVIGKLHALLSVLTIRFALDHRPPWLKGQFKTAGTFKFYSNSLNISCRSEDSSNRAFWLCSSVACDPWHIMLSRTDPSRSMTPWQQSSSSAQAEGSALRP